MTSDVQGQIAPESINIATRNQVMIERLKSHQVGLFRTFLERMEVGLRRRLIAGDITEYQAVRVARLLDGIASDLQTIFGEYRTALTGDLIDMAIQQAQAEAKQLRAVSADHAFEPAIPSADQIRVAVMSAPLSVAGYNDGALLEPWLMNWSDAQIETVTGVIRQGYYQGDTTDQIVRALRGTKALRYNDGTMARLDRSNTTLVRTAVQHCAQTARSAFYQRNTDIIVGVQWVSTLDSRTTATCRSLDGSQFPVDKGPRPPLHPACRSTTIPVLDEAFDVLDRGATRASKGQSGGAQVPASQTYYEWLKTQPAEFQDIAIGTTRAKLLRSGGLSAERFAELQLGTNFQPLTLDEMRRLEPKAFARAGI